MSNDHKLSGTIKRLNEEKQFGWIRDPQTGQDYFFHFSELIGVEFADLRDGDQVRFSPVIPEPTKGPRANEVERVGRR